MAKRSSGWKVLSTHIQTGGRRATATTAAGSQRRSTATDRSQNRDHSGQQRKNAQIGDLEGLLPQRRPRHPSGSMADIALPQWGPNALRGGKGTACPMETSAATPAEKRG